MSLVHIQSLVFDTQAGAMTQRAVPIIRPEAPTDREGIRAVNRRAFAGEAEAVLVDALRDGGHARLSLVAEVDGRVVGHVLFSDLPIRAEGTVIAALALAPMAVLPEWQRRGIGTALLTHGLTVSRAAGHRIVLVLGHPDYYPRFGFSASKAAPIASPFGGGDAWMALELVPGALDHVAGRADYPPPFGAPTPGAH